jgi:hypothetical protein
VRTQNSIESQCRYIAPILPIVVVRHLLVVEVLAFFASQARNFHQLIAGRRERENLDGNDTTLMDVWT